MIRSIFKTILVIILLAIGVASVLQAFTKIYNFPPSRQFSGETIYNPYRGIDSTAWRKANFHAHQRYMLFGLDFEYTAQEFIDAYRAQNYDIIGLADHQQINEWSHTPAYEHGIGLNNYHLLMLGAEEVSWFDYPFMALPQHQMQYQIDKFKPQVKLLGINHASRHRGIPVKVFDNLMGYDLMEMNPDIDATAWDRALSNGVYSTLVANDDAHCIDDRGRWFQACYTMLNTESLDDDDIYAALKAGKAYGVVIIAEQNQKPEPHADLPEIRGIDMKGDTIDVRFSIAADSVRFIGQDAKVLFSTAASGRTAQYSFRPADTYVRIEAFFAGGTKIWTNPFYRTGGAVREAITVNVFMTTLNAIGWGVVTLFILWLVILVLRRKPRRRLNYYC